jgi:hypothetical protein
MLSFKFRVKVLFIQQLQTTRLIKGKKLTSKCFEKKRVNNL